MKKILSGLVRFQKDSLPQLQEHFRRLANGQTPSTVFITCSDSRIDPELITNSKPGEIFVIRNAGNMVPAYEYCDTSIAASLEYAVKVLKVSHAVVCGHSDCGAMKGLINPAAVASLPMVSEWLENSAPVRDELDYDASEADRLTQAIDLNVALQMKHLLTHPCISERVNDGELTVHGMVFDIGSGDFRITAPNGYRPDEPVLASTLHEAVMA